MTGGGTRRLRAFAVTQIAASFVLLAGAAMLLKTLLALQAVQTGIDTRRVLAINVPVLSYGRTERPGGGLLQRSDAAGTPVAGRGRRRSRHAHAVAGGRFVRPRLPIYGRGIRSRDGGRRSARPIPHCVARIFRLTRRPDARRARFQRSRPQRQRAGDHHQPKCGAADVPEPGGAQSASHFDRSGDPVYRHEADAHAHHRNRRGY